MISGYCRIDKLNLNGNKGSGRTGGGIYTSSSGSNSNNKRYEWVREEYCSNGFERFYEDQNDDQRTGWYRVIAANAGDNNTPPPNLPQTWEKLE
jgi:hypothetical protein